MFSLIIALALGNITPLQDYVDTRVGTAAAVTATSERFGRKSEEHGQTIPAVTPPHGMNMWTPQTRDTEHKCVAPYYWADSLMQGFRCSHWINGGCTQDYGSFTIMPLTGNLVTDPVERATPFSHDSEIASPSLYKVSLPREKVEVELSATERTGIMRLIYNYTGDAYLVVNPNSDESQATVDIDPAASRITGMNPVHRIYQGKGEPAGFSGNFVVEIDRPLTDWGVYDDSTRYDGHQHIEYTHGAGAWVGFHVTAGDTVLVRAASSFVDRDGARLNLVTEQPTWDFDSVSTSLADKWNKELGKIEVSGGTETDRRKFYGSLWRASLLPRIASDVDGRYMAFAGSGEVKTKAPGEVYYDDYSMWDTYRALHPLQIILSPSRSGQMMQSLVDKARQGGWFPIFPCWNSYTAAMIGDHCASVITDAWVKGVRDFDVTEAYRLLRQNACDSPDSISYRDGMGRRALDSYLKYNYIPLEDTVPYAYHKREQVSRTIEYAYDDFALARLARELGLEADAGLFHNRSLNFLNVFPTTGWATGRYADGSWSTDASPRSFNKYITEGMPCHYSFTQFNLDELARKTGGRDALVARLDSVFDEGYYWHGNEPCHHLPWLAAMTGEPDKTASRVKYIMESEYLDQPGGLSGNDDAGQMSAWYVFAAMGFYPVTPGTDEYIVAAPAFDRIVIHGENGKNFTIEAPGATAESRKIKSIKVNGKSLTDCTLKHHYLIDGATLSIELENK